jgi:hypothetical protein
MKLLLAFKSFQPRRPIVEIGGENWFAAGSQFGSENWFAAGCQFGSENWFAVANSISAVNVNSLQPTQFQQRITISLLNTQFGNEC